MLRNLKFQVALVAFIGVAVAAPTPKADPTFLAAVYTPAVLTTPTVAFTAEYAIPDYYSTYAYPYAAYTTYAASVFF